MDFKLEAYHDSLSFQNKMMRLFWNVCCFFLFKPFGGPLFWRWRNFVLRIFGAKVGKESKVSNRAVIWSPWNIELGAYVSIGAKASLYSVDKIIIGDKVTISQGAFLCTASHDIDYITKPLITRPITVASFSWICAESYVGMGVTIGEGAVVGARAVVVKDVAPWTVVGGNPAKEIKKRVIKSQ